MPGPQDPTLETIFKDSTLRVRSVAEDLKSLTPQQFEPFEDSECHIPGVVALPAVINAIVAHGKFERPKDQIPREVEFTKNPHFEYAEHFKLSDALTLPGWKSPPFKLKNRLEITYGQISALASDFFRTPDPISMGQTFEEQKDLFRKAFRTLNEGNITKPQAIIAVLQEEVDEVNEAVKNYQPVKEVYERLGSRLSKLQDASLTGTTTKKAQGEDYESLLKVNIDHFAPNCHTAYVAGHAVALDAAKAKDLGMAYAMNAFADHFLEDAFASGHFRVPREAMMDTNLFANACSNFMHNQDNKKGLFVQTGISPPFSWRAYGDSMLFEKGGATTQVQVFAAIKASVQNIYDAYK